MYLMLMEEEGHNIVFMAHLSSQKRQRSEHRYIKRLVKMQKCKWDGVRWAVGGNNARCVHREQGVG